MARFDEVKHSYESTIYKLSSEPTLWKNFLTCVCRNYKLRFDEQILLFAQRPHATAVATFEQWFKLYRPVKKGQDAICVFEEENGIKRRYKRYYDISDTITTNRSKEVPIWTMKDDYQEYIVTALEQSFGTTDKSSFERVIISSAQNIADEYLNSYTRSILQSSENSFLEGLGEDAILNMYCQIVTDSVAYTMLSRLDMNADELMDTDSFSDIVNFNTIQSLFMLGKATQQLSVTGLSVIAKAIKDYERDFREENNHENIRRNDPRRTHSMESDKERERRTARPRTGDRGTPERILQQEERTVVHTRLGNSNIRTQSYNPDGRGKETGNILKQSQGLPQNGKNGDVRRFAVLRNAEQAPQRNTGEMLRATGKADGRNVQKRGRDLRASENELVGIRSEEREYHSESTGNRTERTDLRLNNNVTPQQAEIDDKSTSAFLLSDTETSPLEPMHTEDENLYGDRFFVYEECERINWMYFNPDGNDGNGQFVTVEIRFENIIEAQEKTDTVESFFDYISMVCKTNLSDVGTIWYEEAYSEFNEVPTFIGCTDKTMNALISFVNRDKNIEIIKNREIKETFIDNFSNNRVLSEEKEEQSQDEIHNIAVTFGANEELLREIINRNPNEHSLNEFGRFDKFLDTVDKTKAREYFEKEENSTLSSIKVNAKLRKFLRDFILNHEPVQKASEQHEIDNTTEESESEKTEEYEKIANFNEGKIDFNLADYEIEEVGKVERYNRNIEAIKILKKCESEGRLATHEEQIILSKYVGWGGLADYFDERNSKYGELKSLLTDSEYESARESTLTAFYTPPVVIKAVYDTLERLGFSQGNILEPSCGVGNFIGMIPTSMQKSKVYGVELDSISASIAKQLYQKANIQNSAFENTQYPDNFFDVVIGNVPFGDIRINDRRYNKYNFLIHDYFFAKSLDKLRPGGVMALITSKGAMDKTNPTVRKYIAERAELLGAVRLPNNTFKGSAGTEVTSDILILQKREKMIEIEPDWVHLDTDDNGITMNSYFVNNPEMILGKMETVSGPYGMVSTCSPIDGTDLEAQLNRVISQINGRITENELTEYENEDEIYSIPADPNVRNYSYTAIEGKVYFRENSVMKLQNVNGMAEKRIKALIPIRDCVRNLITLQTENYPDEVIEKAQQQLNALYDRFQITYGRIRSRGNYIAFKEDSSYSLLSSLENVDDKGNFISKADIFSKRTISPHIPISHVETSEEALALSLGEKACVDMEYMCSLTDKSEDDIYRDLSGSIFLNPMYTEGEFSERKYLPQDEYLSGNVREKLKIARLSAKANSNFNINVTALERVQPKDLTAAEISVRLGTTWIDEKYIQQFMVETFDLPGWTTDKIQVQFSDYSSSWRVENKSYYSNVKTSSVYGTKRINGLEILERTLNLKDVKIYDYFEDSEGKRYSKLNDKETQIAQEKQQELKQAFQDWIWKDPDRRNELTTLYNERFNSERLREYDGSRLIFAGMNPEITLRPHQLNAIARIIYGGNALLAHVVGAGKTFEMVAAAQESKRLGMCNKSLIVVPKHLTEQWGSDYMRLYPAANILVAQQSDFSSAERRRRFCSRIATGDYDAIIIGQTQFESIKMSVEYQRNHIEAEINEITRGIQSAKADRNNQFTVKDLERTKKNLTAKLEKLNDQNKKDEGITFEELGVDRLFIDEAHYYKNLFMYTKMQNIKGVNSTQAEKSSDMYMKVRYIDEMTNGRGIIFATGTPISNSMVEMYTMQRYLQYETLRSKGLQNFDSWASTFGETVTDYELKPEGQGYQLVTRFAKFTNLPELVGTFKKVADIQTSDMLNLEVPNVERHNVVLQPSSHQKSMINGLAKRAEDFRNGKLKNSPQEMLLITNEGRLLALDQRVIDPLLPDHEQSKTTACAENVFKIYQETYSFKGTQMVFCDISTPGGKSEFCAYEDLREKLVNKGIPKEEIKFIHEANNDKAKDELFSKVRNGTVRVLIGSTNKMGAGTNVQDKLIALHHLDCPWTPADLEQREGRIIRQGNTNNKVHIYTYVTEGTFDAYMYQLVLRKQNFISQIMSGNTFARTCEDINERSLNYSEIMAIATGNPMIKEVAELERDISLLTTLRTNFYRQQYSLEDDTLKRFPQEIARLEKTIVGLKHDISVLKLHPKPLEGFIGITINGVNYNDKTKGGEAIIEACKTLNVADKDVIVGEYRGFSLSISFNSFEKSHQIKLTSELTQCVTLGKDPVGNIQRLDNKLASLTDYLETAQQDLQDTRKQLETAKVECKKQFPKEKELQSKTQRLNEIRAILSENGNEKDVPTENKTM